jgi:cytochrome P450
MNPTIPAFDPDTVSFAADPYPLYRRLRDESPVHRHEQSGEEAVWVLSRFEDVADALADWRTFSSVESKKERHMAPGGRGNDATAAQLILTDPPRHDRLRAVVKSHFTPRHIASLEAMIRDRVTDALGRIDATAGAVDVAADFAWPVTLAVASELIGIPEEDRATVLSWYQTAEYLRPHELADEALANYTRYFDELTQERAARPCEDLTSILMRSVAAGDLEPAEATLLCKELFEGGVDVPANLIANAIVALVQRPEQRALLADDSADEARLRDAVEELARYDCPIQYLPRRTTAEFARHDTVIPAGASVLLMLGSANRDERRFSAPDVLDVTRPSLRNVAFGAGIHFCIGAPLARLETRLAVPALLRALGDLVLDGPAVRPTGSVLMRAFLNLRVRSASTVTSRPLISRSERR